MRKILIGLAATIVLLLAAALIGPSFVDWNKFKPVIAERVKAATGRDLSIGGDISLSILPAPTLSAHNVTLANMPGAREPIMASLKSLGVRVELVPLLQGKIKVESLTLVEPVIALETLADGRHNWDLAPPAAAPAAGAAPKAPPQPAPPVAPQPATESKTGAGEAIEIGSFSIENGTVTYRDDASGTTERIEKLNTEITAESLAGPISVDGDLVAHGIKLAIKAETGNLAASPIPLHLDVSLPDADAKLSFGGSLSALNADGQVTGKISAEGSDLSRVAALAQQGTKPAFPAPLAQKFSAAGDVSGSAKAIAIKDLKLALGDTLASGAITVGVGPPLRIDVTAAMTSLELDPWIASATAAKSETKNDAGAGDNQKPGATPSAAVAAAGFALPKTITATLDLSIDAAVYQRDLIRDVKLRAALDGGKLLIQQASASFPGGSSLSATGTLAGDGGKPAFDGSVAVLSDNLRGTFDWLKIDMSSVPAERLHKFAATGKIKGTPEQFEFSGLDLKLDTSHMTGGVVVALRDKPALGARFDLDQLDLDAYMPPPANAAAQPGAPAKSNPAPAAPSGNAAGGGLAALKSFDANVVAKIGSLTVRGMQIQNVGFDGTLQNGVLTARDLSAGDFGGGSAKLSGVLSGLGDKPAVDGAFAVTVKDPARLMTLANRQPPSILTRLGPVGFSGNAKGALDAFSFDTALDIAGGKLTALGTAGLLDSGAKFDIAVDAKHADLAGLIRVYNPEYRPAAQNLGALALSLHLRGDTAAAELSDLKGNIGPVAVQGGAHANFKDTRPFIDANLQASEIIADLFLPPNPNATAAPSGGKPASAGGGGAAAQPPSQLPPGQHWSKEPFDFSPLKLTDAEVKLTAAAIAYGKYRVDKPELALSLKNGVLDIHDLKGTMFQGPFDLKAQLDTTATPKLSGDVTISKADIHEALFSAGNIDVASGKLDFGMKTAGAGASPFDLVSSLAGNGTMQVTDGVVQGFDLKAISDRLKNLNSAMDFLAAFGTSMSGGQTKFSKLAGTFTIDKGVVRTDAVDLQAEAGAGKITGTIDLPAWMIDMRGDFTLTDHPKVPGFGMRVSGPLDSPERKLETKDLEAYLIQRGVGSLLKKVLPGEQVQPGAAPGTAPAKPLDQLLKKILPGQQPQPAQLQPTPAAPAAPAQQPAAQPPAQTVPQQPAPPQPAPQAAPQLQQPQLAPAAPATPAAPAQQPAAQPQPAAPAAPAQQPAAQPPTETAPAPQAPAQPESSQQSQPQKKQKGFNKLLQQLLQPPPDQTAPTQTPGTQ